MADYPSSITAPTNPSATSEMDDTNVQHDVQHANTNNEVVAIETELGTTPKAPSLATPASSASSVANLLGMILQRFKDITALTNWYDSFTSIPVSKGGTGNTTLTSGNVLTGNGTGAISSLATSGSGSVARVTGPALDTPVLTTPNIITALRDSSGNELIKVSATASAVNEITLANGATGANAVLSASGETNTGLDMKMNGTGKFRRPTIIELPVGSASVSLATGDGQAFFRVPDELNGMNLTGVSAAVYTAGTTNTLDVQIRNKTQTADMLTTKITIDSTETDTSTAATPAVIDTNNDDVATGDIIAVDIDAVHSTPAKGLIVQLRFELP